MIRWEEQGDGTWTGFSGELPVATLKKALTAETERWLWAITGAKRPKWWRKGAGHRTTLLGARRSAETYWERWLDAAGLQPDIRRLALLSLPETERRRATR